MSSSGLPSTRETWTYWSKSSKGHTDAEGTEASFIHREAAQAGTVQPGEEKSQGDLSQVYKNTRWEGVKKMETDAFQWYTATRDNGHNLKNRKFHLNT